MIYTVCLLFKFLWFWGRHGQRAFPRTVFLLYIRRGYNSMESLATQLGPKCTPFLSCCVSPLLLWSSTLQLLQLICSSGEEILNITSPLLRPGNNYQQMVASWPTRVQVFARVGVYLRVCVFVCFQVCVLWRGGCVPVYMHLFAWLSLVARVKCLI